MYIHPYREEWKTEYLRESDLIRACYGAEIELHHIGSTAVVGLYAKDCIDILGVVIDLSDVAARKDALVELGYRHKGAFGIVGREYFSKDARKVHLHVYANGDANIEKHLTFVARMQGDPTLIGELNRLKIRLHERYPNDSKAYQAEKSDFYVRFDQQR